MKSLSKDKVLNIVSMTQGLDGAIPWYRITQPLGYLQKKGKVKYINIDAKKETKDLLTTINGADVIIWQAQVGGQAGAWLETIQKINTIENRRRLDVFEYDDNLWDINPHNPKYNVFGTKEYFMTLHNADIEKYKSLNKASGDNRKMWQLPNGSWEFKMWEDGRDGFHLEDNVKRMNETKNIIRDCTLLTVTTKELADKMIKHTQRKKPIAALPNLLDFDLWRPAKPNTTGKLRIGWQGGSSHYADIKLVEDALLELEKEIDFTLVVAGQLFKGIHRKFKDVEFMGWHSDIRTYPMHMRDFNVDIAICPLEENAFNEGKSPLKWIEYSALKIPTIASNVTPYKQVIKQNRSGVLVNNTKGDWLSALARLAKNKEERDRIANNANNAVKKNWSVQRSEEWYEAYMAFKPNANKMPLLKGVK